MNNLKIGIYSDETLIGVASAGSHGLVVTQDPSKATFKMLDKMMKKKHWTVTEFLQQLPHILKSRVHAKVIDHDSEGTTSKSDS